MRRRNRSKPDNNREPSDKPQVGSKESMTAHAAAVTAASLPAEPAPAEAAKLPAPKGTNPEQLLSSLNTIAQRVQSLWISFISFGAYLTITVLGTTHRVLLLEEGVRLPIFNIDLPLTKFYLIAPAFLLIFHFYVLTQLMLLARLASAFNAAVDGPGLTDPERDALRMRLDNSVFLQLLSGAAPERKGANRWLMLFIAVLTIVILPVTLFLLIQLQFLPYQDKQFTTFHRLLLCVDMLMVFILWPFYSRTGGLPSLKPFVDTENRKAVAASLRRFVRALIAPAVVGIFSWCIAVMPNESLYENPITRIPAHAVAHLDALENWSAEPHDLVPQFIADAINSASGATSRYIISWRDKPRDSENAKPVDTFSFTELLFELRVDYVTSTQLGFFSNRIVLPGQSISNEKLVREADDAEKNTKPGEQRTVHQFRGRYLINAVLEGADLRRSDFTGAHLNYATLKGASLHRSRFGCADRGRKVLKPGTESVDPTGPSEAGAGRLAGDDPDDIYDKPEDTLECSLLTNINLNSAKLTGADLRGLDLSALDWSGAELQGANLKGANLSGARLVNAQLQGAVLDDAKLNGAALTSAAMQGASLEDAQLTGASMVGVNLTGANLLNTQLSGASLNNARLYAAKLTKANLRGAFMTGAHLDGAVLDKTNLEFATLRQARVWRTSESPVPQKNFLAESLRWEQPLVEAARFAEWRDAQTQPIPDDAVRARVAQALAILNPEAASPRTPTPNGVWTGDYAKKTLDDEYKNDQFKARLEIACNDEGAPHVAYRFISGQRFSQDLSLEQVIARFKNSDGSCPGVIGLSPSSHKLLARQYGDALIRLACAAADAPKIARRLIEEKKFAGTTAMAMALRRFEEANKPRSHGSDGSESGVYRPPRCPGAVGLTGDDLARLKAQAEAETKK